MAQDQDNAVYLTTIEAARYLRLSTHTLERMRVDGSGPRFLKAGPGLRAKVLYKREDLEAWLQGFSFESTAEYNLPNVRDGAG